MKIREVFEYEVETDDINKVFTVNNYVKCVDDMSCPFWDGYYHPNITDHKFEIIND